MRAPLAYSKKIYLASLALFWGGLCAGFLAVLLLSCRQSFAARTRALLDRQHTVAATLANDTAALLEEQMNRRGETLTPFFYAMFVNRYR